MEFAQAATAARPEGDPRRRADASRSPRHADPGRPSPPDAAGPGRARLGESLPAAHARLGAHAGDRRAPLARRAVGDARRHGSGNIDLVPQQPNFGERPIEQLSGRSDEGPSGESS